MAAAARPPAAGRPWRACERCGRRGEELGEVGLGVVRRGAGGAIFSGRVGAGIDDLVRRARGDRGALLAAGGQGQHGQQNQRGPHASASCQRAASRGDVGRGGAAIAGARGDRGVHRQHVEHAGGDAGLLRLHLGQAQAGQVDALRLGLRHQPAGDVVGGAERQLQHPHQPVRQVGRGGEAAAGHRPHAGQVGRRSRTMPAMAARLSARASAASNTGSLSSCVSLA